MVSIQGNGNSNSPKIIALLMRIFQGNLQYRLKQIDNNGKN